MIISIMMMMSMAPTARYGDVEVMVMDLVVK